MIIAPCKRVRIGARGDGGKRGWVEWLFTQGGGLSGLALIPYPKLFIAERSAASETAWRAGHAQELLVVGRTIGFGQGRGFAGNYAQRSVRAA
jgi:hypothetical protein